MQRNGEASPYPISCGHGELMLTKLCGWAEPIDVQVNRVCTCVHIFMRVTYGNEFNYNFSIYCSK